MPEVKANGPVARKPPHTKNADSPSVAVRVCKAWIVGLLVGSGAVLLFAQLLSGSELPLYAAVPMATMAVSLGTMTAGFTLGKAMPSESTLWGLALGAGFCLCLVCASLVCGVTEFGAATWSRIAAVLLAGGLGGAVGGWRRRKRLARRRH